MLKDILPLVPEHDIYTEVFAGGAALLFAKSPVRVNVINDLNGELVNFYRTVVADFDALRLGPQPRTTRRGLVHLPASGLLQSGQAGLGRMSA